MKNITEFKKKLDNCLEHIMFTRSCFYNKYEIQFIDDCNQDFGALYNPIEQKITIVNNGYNYGDLLFCTALHELAHHIDFIQTGKSDHNTSFLEIQKKLMYSAFDLGYMNPSKLALSEMYLGLYTECDHIVSLCINYQKNKPQTKFFLEMSKEKLNKNYYYNPVSEMYYHFVQKETKNNDNLLVFNFDFAEEITLF